MKALSNMLTFRIPLPTLFLRAILPKFFFKVTYSSILLEKEILKNEDRNIMTITLVLYVKALHHQKYSQPGIPFKTSVLTGACDIPLVVNHRCE